MCIGVSIDLDSTHVLSLCTQIRHSHNSTAPFIIVKQIWFDISTSVWHVASGASVHNGLNRQIEKNVFQAIFFSNFTFEGVIG